MSNFKDCPEWKIHNDYYTPKYAWEWINDLIPKDKIIWESCMLNSIHSKSPQYLRELGNQVVYDINFDMLVNQPDNFDMIITNPPFETDIKKKILMKLIEIDKPFILVMNGLNMLIMILLKLIIVVSIVYLFVIKWNYHQNNYGSNNF